MKIDELLHIINDCVPIDNGFLDEATGEIFTLEEMEKLVEQRDNLIDRVGIACIEADKRREMKKELSAHYKDEEKREEKRVENMKFFLGYLTGGEKKKCEHVTVSFNWKQERVQMFVPDSKVPDEFKKDVVRREVDKELLRAELEKHNPALEGIARIDTRKKASVK